MDAASLTTIVEIDEKKMYHRAMSLYTHESLVLRLGEEFWFELWVLELEHHIHSRARPNF